MKHGAGERTGDTGWVGETGEGTVRTKLGRSTLLLLTLLPSGMIRYRVGASTRCGFVSNSCVVIDSPEAV